MSTPDTDNNVKVYEVGDPVNEFFANGGKGLEFGCVTASIIPVTVEEQEEAVANQDPHMSSGQFEFARMEFLPLFRAMVATVFQKFKISTRKGVDIGSGATGAMVHELLPLSVSERLQWTECEINPGAIAIHTKKRPGANIREGSYLRLKESLGLTEPVETITGLSSLDTTTLLDRALREVRDALQIGGYLVHVQDVRPGIQAGIEELNHLGFRPPYEIAFGGAKRPGTIPNPHAYVFRTSKEIYLRSSADLFGNTLTRKITSTPGMRLCYNAWLMAQGQQQPGDQFSDYFLNAVRAASSNDSTKTAYALVTVAQRTF